MWKTLLIGALHLSLFTIPACGPAGSRPELTEAEYRLYRGTGEDLQEQEDRAVFGATAVGAMGSAQGPAPLLVACALVAGRVADAGDGSPAPAGRRRRPVGTL